MDKRLVAVWTTATLLLLALAHSGNARTFLKTTAKKPVATRSSRDCVRCNTQKSKVRSTKKRAVTARKLPCHPKDYVDPKIARNYKSALLDMKRARIKPEIT